MPKIVCFCGSTRFKADHDWQAALWKSRGYIVLGSTIFGHSVPEHAALLVDGVKEMIDAIHLAQIDMCDLVFVLNRDGYIGESTRREIAHAQRAGKPIAYLEKDASRQEQ